MFLAKRSSEKYFSEDRFLRETFCKKLIVFHHCGSTKNNFESGRMAHFVGINKEREREREMEGVEQKISLP